MNAFKFPGTNAYEDHWKHLEKFITSKYGLKLGFKLHDLNGDGRICPGDVFDFANRLQKTQTLIGADIFHLINAL